MASTMVARAHAGDALAHLVEVASALADLQRSSGPPPNPTAAPRRRAPQSAAAAPADADYVSVVSDSNDEESATTAAGGGAAASPLRRGSTGTGSLGGFSKRELFPQRLHEILRDAALGDVVAWLPHGTAFVVLRPDVFTAEVLPRYLPSTDARGSTKYASFTRKLNRWGFRQATRGPDTGAFSHPLFLRDRPELCRGMVCQRSRDSGSTTGGTGSLKSPAAAALPRTPRQPAAPSPKRAARPPAPVEEPVAPEATAAPEAAAAAAAAVPSAGASSLGMPPEGITRDQAVVEAVLKQRDELERLRVARQMLFESYMRVLQQPTATTTSTSGDEEEETPR